MLIIRCKFKWIPLLILWLAALGEPTVRAESYVKGYQEYLRSDFASAEASLITALKTSFQPPELAKILKLLGICQFMQGKRPAATKSFKMALRYDPETFISTSEVLDEEIIPFFEDVKLAVEDEKIMKLMTAGAANQSRGGKKGPPKPKAKAKAMVREKKEKANTGAKMYQPEEFDEKSSRRSKAKPVDYYDTKKSRNSRKPSKSQGSAISFWTFLPFGAGQFANGSYFTGMFFFAAEAGALGLSFYIDNEVKKLITESDAVMNDPDYSDEDKLHYYENSKNYIAEKQQQSNLALIGFGALYITGIIEAWIRADAPAGRAESRPPLSYRLYASGELSDTKKSRDLSSLRGSQHQLFVGMQPVSMAMQAKARLPGPALIYTWRGW